MDGLQCVDADARFGCGRGVVCELAGSGEEEEGKRVFECG